MEQVSAKVSILAPNTNHHHNVDYLSNNELYQSRNILSESARIARGNISQIRILTILIWTHWYGQNIFNYAIKGSDFTI